MTNDNILGSDSVGKLFVKLTIPAILGQIINMMYNIVDRIYVGRIESVGALAITGMGVCMPILIIITAFSSLIGMGAAPQATIKMGEGKYDDAESILGTSFVMLSVIGISLTIVILLFLKDILFAFGASGNTIDYAMDYARIYVIGTIFVQLSMGLNTFITYQGYAWKGMATIAIGAIINIVLDPILIYGFNMGVKGAALATVISQCISSTWVIIFLCSTRSRLRIKRRFLKVKLVIVKKIVMLGVSPFIMQSTESLVAIIFNSSLFKYGGDISVGSMSVIMTINQLMFLPLLGLTQGAQPIISFNYGCKNHNRVNQCFKILFISSMIFSIIFYFAIIISPRTFIGMFTTDNALIENTVWSMRIFCCMYFVLGLQISCQQTFVALGQAKISFFLALLRKLVLLIPMIYIFPLFGDNKVLSVLLAEPIADSISVTITLILFFRFFTNYLKEASYSINKI